MNVLAATTAGTAANTTAASFQVPLLGVIAVRSSTSSSATALASHRLQLFGNGTLGRRSGGSADSQT